MTAREKWRKTYRMMRIIRRESDKAAIDQMIYGSSCIKMNDNGEPEHVPIMEIDQWVKQKAQSNAT